MSKQIQVDKICESLKNTSSIASIVQDRVFYGEPMREQTGIYITINTISQIVDVVDKKVLVDVRFIGDSSNVTKKSLLNLSRLVDDVLTGMDGNQTYSFSGFYVYKVVEGNSLQSFVDEKNRNILIKDYIFYFLS